EAQWTFGGYFPDSRFAMKGSGVHGIAVDPAGKILVQWYGRTDSIQIPGGTYAGTIAIHVFNPNGTQASFSPLKVLSGAGVNDTLFSISTINTNVGLRRDINGHILASIREKLYRLNYQTGQVMNKVVSGASGTNPTITAVGVDTLGEIFVQQVFGGNPIRIWAPNFTSLGNVTDTSRGFCRTGEVSKDGNDYYSANYTLHCIYRYHSDFGSFGPYTVGPNDTLFKGFDCESMVWNWARNRLWLSSGSKNDMPNRYPGVTTNYSINTWYAWNPTSGTFTDSLKWFWYNLDSAATRPRAIDFSPDGNTAYVGCFGAGSYPSLEKFTRVSSVKPDPEVIPNGFILAQNYPNPFNPTTEIRFQINKAGHTTLTVYDLTGKLVETLVDQELAVGGYTATFDASKLASGTYFYRLTQDGQSVAKKMLLTK
ncbi:MAG: T9SS type A sorting domain-containing protein, partial [Bacteroidota bacterium]